MRFMIIVKATQESEAGVLPDEKPKRFPNPAIGGKDGEIEVRQLFELEDFEPALGTKSEAIGRFREMGIGGKK